MQLLRRNCPSRAVSGTMVTLDAAQLKEEVRLHSLEVPEEVRLPSTPLEVRLLRNNCPGRTVSRTKVMVNAAPWGLGSCKASSTPEWQVMFSQVPEKVGLPSSPVEVRLHSDKHYQMQPVEVQLRSDQL
jgi:hypothetical protein